MKEKFDLRTLEGSKRIFRISVAAVILFSFFAYMFACNWGRVKISELNIDSRGSVMQATMYTPKNTNSESAARYGKSPYGQHLKNVADDKLQY